MSIAELINRAQKEHLDHPYDSVHDFEHHQRVVENVTRIIELEHLDQDESFRPEIAIAAAWWHDYKRNDLEGCLEDVGRFCDEFGVDSKTKQEILRAIKGHSIESEQDGGIYSRVLFDADKLEYVAQRRFELGVEAVRRGDLSEEKFEWYKKHKLIGQIGIVFSTLHFDSSRREYKNRLKLLGGYVADVPEYSDVYEFLQTDPQVADILATS